MQKLNISEPLLLRRLLLTSLYSSNKIIQNQNKTKTRIKIPIKKTYKQNKTKQKHTNNTEKKKKEKKCRKQMCKICTEKKNGLTIASSEISFRTPRLSRKNSNS